MTEYLQNLNEAQREAVLHQDGPMIIIAGAGSGKTRVLTYRIAHLMSKGVDAFSILSLTFTNKAAREMKKRIGQIVGESEAKNLWMGTFHSVFARILRSEADKLGYPSNFTIYDTQDSVRLISSIIKELNLDKEKYKPKQVLGRISQFKNSLITVKAYYQNADLQEADVMASRPKIGDIYHHYVERCFKAGAMDFDDLLLRTNELLTRFPAVLAKYQQRFKYILVDEYQDTNHSQYLIVRALADRFQNICVVGDDSQSIYAFRGANIQNILNFQRDYDDVKIFKLEQNYRSTSNIVDAANSVIEKNKTKLDKEIWTANDNGEKVKIKQTFSEREEGKFVADSIFDNKLNGQLRNNEFAVLYRTNSQSRAIEDALREKNIAYRIYGGLSFYQRKEVKDVLSYLRLLVNPSDEEALKRVINYPGRGIGQTTVDRLVVAANHYEKSIFEIIENINKIDLKINGGTKNKLNDFITMIKSFQIEAETKNAFEVAEHVIRRIQVIKDLEKDVTPEAVSRVENIQVLLSGIKEHIEEQKEAGEDESLVYYLENKALVSDLDNDRKQNNDAVSLMTIHLAKGLEFQYVYIVGLEENLFPSAMSMNTRSELEEERRLFYVALTRAEKQAYLTYAQSRYRWGKLIDCEPSRFLEEIDERFLEHLAPKMSRQMNKFVDEDIFGSVPQDKIRFKKPVTRDFQRSKKVTKSLSKTAQVTPPKNLKKISKVTTNLFDSNIAVGNIVSHAKFGKGEVMSLEGIGSNKKAEIKFEKTGSRKLLLQFAKLEILI